jgi:hypothetical protein
VFRRWKQQGAANLVHLGTWLEAESHGLAAQKELIIRSRLLYLGRATQPG